MTDWYDELTKSSPSAPAAPPTDWYGEVTGKAAAPKPAAAPAPATDEPYSGTILPFSRDAQGNTSFDSNAGLLGVLKRAVTAPGDVVTGKVDPYSPEGESRAREMVGVITPGSAALSAGERVIPGALKNLRPTKPAVPSAEALKEAGAAGFERARNMGVDYSADAIKAMGGNIQRSLEEDGILAELSPKTFAIVSKLQSPPEGAVGTVQGLIAARRALQNAAGDFTNKTEQAAANRAIKELDKFLLGDNASSVLAGPAAAAGREISEARGNYAASLRSEKITGAAEKAERNAAVANSGLNVDNQVRQRVRDLLQRPKEARGFSAEELTLMEEVARGNFATNTARKVGNALGGGGGLGATFTGTLGAAGGAMTGEPTAAVLGAAALPALGYGSRQLASNMTLKRLEQLDKTIRMRSPLYRQMLKDAPQEAKTMEGRASLLRLWLVNELEGEN
jgi:hypothetical protein